MSSLETGTFGEGGGARARAVVSLNQNQGYLYTYFLLFFFLERRGAGLNLAFDFLLLIPFSQSEKLRATQLGGEGAGTFGNVERAGQVSRLREEGGRSGNS